MTITSSCQGLGAPHPWGAACRPSLRLSHIAPGDVVVASSCPRTRPTNPPAPCSSASPPNALQPPNPNAAVKAFDSDRAAAMTIASSSQGLGAPQPWGAACLPSLRLSPIAPDDGVVASSSPRTRPTNQPAICWPASKPNAPPRPSALHGVCGNDQPPAAPTPRHKERMHGCKTD